MRRPEGPPALCWRGTRLQTSLVQPARLAEPLQGKGSNSMPCSNFRMGNQGGAVGYGDMGTVNADDAVQGQLLDDPGEGLGLHRQARGQDALADVQVEAAPVLRNMGQQIAGDPALGVVQGEVVDLTDEGPQALTQGPHDNEAGVHRFTQHGGKGAGVDADQLRGLQGGGAHRVARGVEEHQSLGKGLAGGDDLDDLLRPLRGEPKQPDLALMEEVEAPRWVALAEQPLTLVQVYRHGRGRDLLQLGMVKAGQQGRLAQ